MLRVIAFFFMTVPGAALFAASAQAQDLSVVIRVAHEHVPLAAATVRVGVQTRATNAAGEALFRVAPGRYVVSAQRIGFTTHADTLSIAADTVHVIELEEEAVESEEIIVTSTRGDRRIQDEPVKVEVVTREEVEEKLLMTPGSVAMLLNETPGLRVQETSPALGGAVIRIQGLEGRYTQLLSDGLPLFGGQAGSLGVLQVPPMDLAQVEVIKGAASSLYGGSALGGVVNLVSRRPSNETELLVNQTTRGGTDAVLWQSRAVSETFGYTGLVSAHAQNAQYIDSDGWADLPRYRRVVARPRFFVSSGSSSAMMTAGVMVEDRAGGGVVPDGSSVAQELSTRRFDIGGTARRIIGSALQLDARGSFSTTGHDHVYGPRSEQDRHTTAFAEASVRGQTGRHYWVVGTALQNDRYSAEQLSRFDYSFLTPSVFLQDEVTFSERVLGSFSVRVDHHSEYGTFVAPRVSSLLRFTDDASVRLTAGRGYYGPTPFMDETEEVGLFQLRALEDLKAEVADLISADLSWAKSGFETNVSLFASRIADALDVVEDGAELELANLGRDTRTKGIDALVRYRLEPFGVTASYTFVDAQRPHVATGILARAPLVPRHAASMVAVYEQHGKGRVGLEVYYTGLQQLEDKSYGPESRAYTLVGLLVEKRFGRVRAFLNMENITNVRQTDFSPLLRPGATSYGRWSTDVWAPIDGRTFNGGIRLQLN